MTAEELLAHLKKQQAFTIGTQKQIGIDFTEYGFRCRAAGYQQAIADIECAIRDHATADVRCMICQLPEPRVPGVAGTGGTMAEDTDKVLHTAARQAREGRAMLDTMRALAVIDNGEADAVARAFEEGATFTAPITVAIGQHDIDLSPGMMALLAEAIRAVQEGVAWPYQFGRDHEMRRPARAGDV